MHFLYDHLSTLLIAGIIFLALIQLTRDGQQVQMESTQYYANRTHMVTLVETLQRDFQNLGAGVAPTDPMILSYSWTESDKSIEFLATLDTTATAPVEQIKYQLVPTPTQALIPSCLEQGVQCYEIQRFLYDGTAYQSDGGSVSTITDFALELRTASGSSVGADPNAAREIFVRVAAFSPMGKDGIIGQSRWQTRFQPLNLHMRDL